MDNSLPPVITVDGPSGSGKGTISQLIAKSLQWHFLDSGLLYRVLALQSKNKKVSETDIEKLADLAKHLPVQFVSKDLGEAAQVLLENQDVTPLLRTPECGNRASKISAFGQVREALFDRQKQFRQWPGLVADGRDMGSVIFPDAKLKIFLQASPEARAKRRVLQLQGQGINVTLAAVLAELIERDERDTQRSVAPLKPASDAWIIDTTNLSINDVHEQIMSRVHGWSP